MYKVLDWFLSLNKFCQTLIVIALLACLVTLLICFFKYKWARILTGCIVYVILMISSIISIFHINNYYSTKGGIIGEITAILKPNQLNIDVENLNIRFENTMLTKQANGKYGAKFESNKRIALDNSEVYALYINNDELSYVEISKDLGYVVCSYSYVFRDKNYKAIASDKMTIYFSFENKVSTLYVEVENGEETNSLWNAYFNKNDFVISIKPVNEIYIANKNLVDIELVIDDKNSKHIKVKKCTDFIPQTITKEGYDFQGWSYEKNSGEFIEFPIESVTENLKLYANWKKIYSVRYRLNMYPEYSHDINSDFIREYSQTYLDGDEIVLPENPTFNNFTFAGWSLDGKNVFDFTNYTINEHTIIFAIWLPDEIPVHFVSVNGNVNVNGIEYTKDKTLGLLYDEEIIINSASDSYGNAICYLINFSEPVFNGYSISGYKISNFDSYKTLFDIYQWANYSIDNDDPVITLPDGTILNPRPERPRLVFDEVWITVYCGAEKSSEKTIGDYQQQIGSFLGMYYEESNSTQKSTIIYGNIPDELAKPEIEFNKDVLNCLGIHSTGFTVIEQRNKIASAFGINQKVDDISELQFLKLLVQVFNLQNMEELI